MDLTWLVLLPVYQLTYFSVVLGDTRNSLSNSIPKGATSHQTHDRHHQDKLILPKPENSTSNLEWIVNVGLKLANELFMDKTDSSTRNNEVLKKQADSRTSKTSDSTEVNNSSEERTARRKERNEKPLTRHKKTKEMTRDDSWSKENNTKSPSRKLNTSQEKSTNDNRETELNEPGLCAGLIKLILGENYPKFMSFLVNEKRPEGEPLKLW